MSRKRKETEPDSEASDDGGFDPLEFAALEEFKNAATAVRASKNFINNLVGLRQKTAEIALPKDLPWIETIMITSSAPVAVDDENDDLKREAAFYASSLAAVKQALTMLDQSGVPYKRPLDFYAETVKPDSHMAKVKQVMLNEKARIEGVESRKKQADAKKFSRAVHAETVKERAKAKRDALEAIDKLKTPKNTHNESSSAAFKASIRGKGPKRMRVDEEGSSAAAANSSKDSDDEGGASAAAAGAPAAGAAPAAHEGGGRHRIGPDGKPMKSWKRLRKEEKYGYGGKKKGIKRNSAASSADMSGFSTRRNKAAFGSMKGSKAAPKFSKRPGKSARRT